MAHACNANLWEENARGSGVQGWPGQQETLLHEENKQTPTPQKTKKYFKTLKIFKELN